MAISTIGIMFSRSDGEFPTVEEMARDESYWLSDYGTDTTGVRDWLVIAHDPHYSRYGEEDWEAMDETNWDAIVESVGAELGLDKDSIPSIHEQYAGGISHPTVGVEDALEAGMAFLSASNHFLILAPDSDAVEEARRLSGRLADYPLLDEDAYSTREWKAWEEYAPVALQDEIRDAYRNESVDVEVLERIESLEAYDVLGCLQSMLDYNYGFSGEYSPSFLSIAESFLEYPAPEPNYYVRERTEFRELMNACPVGGGLHGEDECAIPTCPTRIGSGQLSL